MKKTETLQWLGGPDGHLRMIDQTRLPVELIEIDCHNVEAVWEAIKMLRVRGAPAIGIAAAYGVCLACKPPPGRTKSLSSSTWNRSQPTWPRAGRRPSTSSGHWIA